ncbi:MAG: hypothetical protein RUDDFDWM_000832 [Candidatus Fervidibacterota bacterium]
MNWQSLSNTLKKLFGLRSKAQGEITKRDEASREAKGSECTDVLEAQTPLEHAGEAEEFEAVEQATTHHFVLRLSDGRAFRIDRDRVKIGTDPSCDIRIDESFHGYETVSGEHALIERWRDEWVIKDLTKKGIFVNGRRTGENVIRNGYVIRIGEVEMCFEQE